MCPSVVVLPCTTCNPAPPARCTLSTTHLTNITSSSSSPATLKPTNAYPPAVFPAKNTSCIVMSSVTFHVRYRVYNSLPSGHSLQPVEFGITPNTSIYRVFRKRCAKNRDKPLGVSYAISTCLIINCHTTVNIHGCN